MTLYCTFESWYAKNKFLKFSSQKRKKFVTICSDGYILTRLIVVVISQYYTNIECCKLEPNIMIHVNYIYHLKKEKSPGGPVVKTPRLH